MTNDPDTSTLPTAADADTAGAATSTAATHERGRISPVAENVSEGFAQGAKPQDSERIDAVCRWLDEAGITSYLSKVKKNEVAKGLEDRSSAFSLSTPEAQGKELAKEWAKSLPDA